MAKKKTTAKPAEPEALMCPVVSATHDNVHRSMIKEVPWNPRGMTDQERERLSKSLEKFGLVNYLVWNKRTGNLVGGHQRLAELDKRMGGKDYRMWVNVVDLGERDEKNLNILLNNPDVGGAYDLAKLGALFQNKEVDAEDTGFSAAQLYSFFGDAPMAEQPEQLEELAAQMREARERYNKIKEAAAKRDDTHYYLVVFASVDERLAFMDEIGVGNDGGVYALCVNGADVRARFQAMRDRIAALEGQLAARPAGRAKKAGAAAPASV